MRSFHLLLAAFWAFFMPTLEGKNLLTCPYDPRIDKNEFEQNGMESHGKLRAPQIRQRVTKARMYGEMHPTIREWVDNYRKHYFQDSPSSVVLYNDNENGIQIRMYHQASNKENALIVFARTRFNEDDAAWEYKKEPAINPQTGRPWIELSESEWRVVPRGNQVMDEPDQLFLKDVLSILNENFHYYYGMQLVDLGRNPYLNPEELIGKIIPARILLFDEHANMVLGENCSDQQASLWRTLGAPVYSYGDIIDPEYNFRGTCSHCGGKGVVSIYLKSGFLLTVPYYNQVITEEVRPSYWSRGAQIAQAPYFLQKTMEGLERICKERGVNLRTQSQNKTPLTRALFWVYKKTNGYVHELVENEYVEASKNEHNSFEAEVNHMYEVVPIKGLYEEKSSSRANSRSSSRATNSRNKHRNKRSSGRR